MHDEMLFLADKSLVYELGNKPIRVPRGLLFSVAAQQTQSELRLSNRFTQLQPLRCFDIFLNLTTTHRPDESFFFLQMLSRTVTGATIPVFQVGAVRDRLSVRHRRAFRAQTRLLVPFATSKAHAVRVRVYIHSNEHGFLEVWLNDRRVWHCSTCTTTFVTKNTPWLQFGCYRTHNSPETATVLMHALSVTPVLPTCILGSPMSHFTPFEYTPRRVLATASLPIVQGCRSICMYLNGIFFTRVPVTITLCMRSLIATLQRAHTYFVHVDIEWRAEDDRVIQSEFCIINIDSQQ